MRKYSPVQVPPPSPEAAGLLVRLRSHLITGDPCRSARHGPLDKHASAAYYVHARRSPTVHFNANKRSPLCWEGGVRAPHFVLLSYGNLDGTVSSQAKPGGHE